MKSYSQLTYEQRCQIEILKQEGLSQSAIALVLGVSQSTISRELQRNTGGRGYRCKQASHLAKARQRSAKSPHKMTPLLITLIEEKLARLWSPEQISGWLLREKSLRISHESIYLYVWRDKHAGGRLYHFLRHKTKGYRSRASNNSGRGKIKNRISIHDRPEIVDTRGRAGDWEIDLMIGKEHSGAVVTIVERLTRFTVAACIPNKSAATVTTATIALLKPFEALVHTITADNGKEFAYHEQVSAALSTQVYFADPYSSWQRGVNENTNGLLRQYWPKKTDFKAIDEEEVEHVLKSLNARPRKVLGYQTPADILQEQLQIISH